MYFTTQKQQREAYRRLKKEERLTFYKHVLKAVGEFVFCFLLMFAPAFGVALG